MQQSMKVHRIDKRVSWKSRPMAGMEESRCQNNKPYSGKMNGVAMCQMKARIWRWRKGETKARKQKGMGYACMPLDTGFWILPFNTSWGFECYQPINEHCKCTKEACVRPLVKRLPSWFMVLIFARVIHWEGSATFLQNQFYLIT